jgi:hypothetical protein
VLVLGNFLDLRGVKGGRRTPFDIDWKVVRSKVTFADLTIDIDGGEYTKWYIEFKSFITKDTIYSLLGKIALLEVTKDIKFTIAVPNKKAYNLLLVNLPKAMKINLFAMLIDLDKEEINRVGAE